MGFLGEIFYFYSEAHSRARIYLHIDTKARRDNIFRCPESQGYIILYSILQQRHHSYAFYGQQTHLWSFMGLTSTVLITTNAFPIAVSFTKKSDFTRASIKSLVSLIGHLCNKRCYQGPDHNKFISIYHISLKDWWPTIFNLKLRFVNNFKHGWPGLSPIVKRSQHDFQ